MSEEVDIGEKLNELKNLLSSIDATMVPDTGGSQGEMDYILDNPSGYVSDDVGTALNDLRTNILNLSSKETQDLWKQEALTAEEQAKAEKEAAALRTIASKVSKATPSQKAATVKSLTLTDLRTAFRSNIITEDELRVELTSRGYDSTSIETMILLDRQKMLAAQPSASPTEQIQTLVTTSEKSTTTAAKKRLIGRIVLSEQEEIDELQQFKMLALRMAFGMVNEIPNESETDVIKVLSDEGKALFALYKDIKAVLGEVE